MDLMMKAVFLDPPAAQNGVQLGGRQGADGEQVDLSSVACA
jgi:hypothetical protein